MSKWYKAFKIGPELGKAYETGDTNVFAIIVSYKVTDDEGKTTDKTYSIDGETVADALLDNYSEYFVVYPKYRSKDSYDYFIHTWDRFVNTWCHESLPYILSSMLANYNPIDNYDGWEVEKVSGHNRGHQAGKIKTAVNINNDPIIEGSTEHYETTFDDGSTDNHLKWRDKVTAPSSHTWSSGDSNYTDYGTFGEDPEKGTVNLDDNHVMNANDSTGDRNLHKHGNMGTTMTQQMIEKELELRKTDVLNIIVQAFATNELVLLADEDEGGFWI